MQFSEFCRLVNIILVLVSTLVQGQEKCTKGSDCTGGKQCMQHANICWNTPSGFERKADGNGISMCLKGTYSQANAACLKCEAGKYSDADRSSSCKDCDPGLKSPIGATAASQCQECTKGSDCTDGKQCMVGANKCWTTQPGWERKADDTGISMCLKGTYAPANSACLKCEAGKYSDADRSRKCQDCDPGWTSPIGSTAASQCQAPECTKGSDCADGKQCLEFANKCGNTQPGFERKADGNGISMCLKGKYAPANSACLDCEAGKYSDAARSRSCQDCGPGLTSPVGATAASQCQAATEKARAAPVAAAAEAGSEAAPAAAVPAAGSGAVTVAAVVQADSGSSTGGFGSMPSNQISATMLGRINARQSLYLVAGPLLQQKHAVPSVAVSFLMVTSVVVGRQLLRSRVGTQEPMFDDPLVGQE